MGSIGSYQPPCDAWSHDWNCRRPGLRIQAQAMEDAEVLFSHLHCRSGSAHLCGGHGWRIRRIESTPEDLGRTQAQPQTRARPVPTEPPAKKSLSRGTYKVGSDIEPGIYAGQAGTDVFNSCYWARMSGASGNFSELIANDKGVISNFTHRPNRGGLRGFPLVRRNSRISGIVGYYYIIR